MIKDIDLIKYLPKYVSCYDEIKTIANVENAPLKQLMNIQEDVFNNQFVYTCNEQGIKLFERLLNITPSLTDTLDMRKKVIIDKWQYDIPYTNRVFLERLDFVCGKNNYKVNEKFDKYEMMILLSLTKAKDLIMLKELVKGMTPCNIKVNLINNAKQDVFSSANILSGVTCLKTTVIN